VRLGGVQADHSVTEKEPQLAIGTPVRPSRIGHNGVDLIKQEGSTNSWTKWWMRLQSITGLAVGDRLFAVIGLYKNTPETTIIAPPGWSLLINADFLRVYTKIATTDETFPELVSLAGKPQNVSFIFYNPKAGGLRTFAEFIEWHCYRNGNAIESAVGVAHIPIQDTDADPHFLPQARTNYPAYSVMFGGELSFRFAGSNYGSSNIDGYTITSRGAPEPAGFTSWVLGDSTNLAAGLTLTPKSAVRGWPGLHAGLDSYYDFVIVMIGTTPPDKPGLRSPVSGAQVDLQFNNSTFSWIYSSKDGADQGGFSLRRAKVVAGVKGAYEYWNPTTSAWQAQQVTVTSSTKSVTTPPGSWIDGNDYVWAVQVISSRGLTSAWSEDRLVEANRQPLVTITSPAATITTTQPVIKWTNADPEGDVQQTYEVLVMRAEALDQVGFNYFDPKKWSNGYVVWYSGLTNSSATQVTLPTKIHNRVPLVVFVKVNNGQDSPWEYVRFMLDIAAPAAPVMKVTME
jgi:hypothetical protein